MSDKEIETMIQEKRLNAPRVTPERIEQVIDKEEYFRLTGTLTVCVLTLANGFTVTGESACASPENFNEEIGNRIARDNAKNKIWALEGYLLVQQLHEAGTMKTEYVARICHEVNRAYCQAMGDDSQPKWEDAPQWQKDSAMLGVQLHMSGDHGPEASHESWRTQKFNDGWRWGPVKDPAKKEHPCMVDFADLPKEQQAKDFLFRGVVHALSGRS